MRELFERNIVSAALCAAGCVVAFFAPAAPARAAEAPPAAVEEKVSPQAERQSPAAAASPAAATESSAQPAAAEHFPPELVDFVPYEKNPVFTAAGEGHWDAKIRERGWIMRQGDRYLMWYTGYNGTRTGLKALGLATSPDGLTWTRDPHNPIYKERWTEDMMVLKPADVFYMFAEGFRDRHAYPFGSRLEDEPHLLSSRDGEHWRRLGALEFRNAAGKPVDDIYGTPAAYFEDGQWSLFYEKRDLGVWIARSSGDLRVWQNVQDDPVLLPGPGTYDNLLIAVNQIIKHEGRYYAYYHGKGDDDPAGWCTCVAVSEDLLSWQKYPGNPLVRNNRSSGILVPDSAGYRLYTMHDRVDVYFPRSRQGAPR